MSGPSGWDYRNPVHIVFGPGRLAELGSLVKGRPLLVTTAGATRRGLTALVQELLDERGVVYDRVESNPTLEALQAAIADLRGERFGTVVGLGGGSAIDFAKVLSLALATSEFSLERAVHGEHPYDEVEPLGMIAIPTTAGTGSEVTPFATVWDGLRRKKLSVGTPRLFPAVALVDPELTHSLPWEATLGAGLDAYSQCFESIWNTNATPITTALATRGLGLVPVAMRRLKASQDATQARAAMALAALLSGLAISQTRTALAHSMSYPLTAHLGMPHGLACAMVLPAVLAFNVEFDDGRLREVAVESGLDGAPALVRHVAELFQELGVPEAAGRYVGKSGILEPLATEMLTPGRADNNLRPADVDAVRRIIRATEGWLSGTRLP